MKKTIILITSTVLIAGVSQAATVFSANFTGSTETGLLNDAEELGSAGATTTANLDNGTDTGSWSGLSVTAGTAGLDALSVEDTTLGDGNYLYIGNNSPDNVGGTSTVTADFSQAVALNGATVSFDLAVFNSHVGGGNPYLSIQGYSSTGTLVLDLGSADNWRKAQAYQTLASNGSNLFGSSDAFNHNQFNTFTLTLGATAFSATDVTGGPDVGTTTGNAYANSATDLAKLVFSYDSGDRASDWGLDNLVVTGVPEPTSMSLLGLGGLALLLRRRK